MRCIFCWINPLWLLSLWNCSNCFLCATATVKCCKWSPGFNNKHLAMTKLDWRRLWWERQIKPTKQQSPAFGTRQGHCSQALQDFLHVIRLWMFLHKNQFLFSSAVVTQLTNVTDGQNYDIQHLYKTSGSAARPVLVSRASRSALASYRKVTTCHCLWCACWGCAISADNLCLPLQDDPALRPQGRRQTAGCLDSYLIPQITAARPEAGNASLLICCCRP